MSEYSIRPRRRVSPTRLRGVLYELTMDWIFLNEQLPIPSSAGGQRSSNVRVYGHPAEWASDQCRRIADVLWSWHDAVAEHRGETRPRPIVGRAGTRGRREQQVIVDAWKYLEPRIEEILTERVPLSRMCLPAPWLWEWMFEDDAFGELFDLRRTIKFRTAQARPKYVLPLPCPSSECGMRALERVFGMKDRPDFIVCSVCGYTVNAENYSFLVRTLVDTLPKDMADGA